MTRVTLTATAAALIISACVQNAPQPQMAASPAPAINTAMPSKDEQACLRSVSTTTANGDVVLLQGTETSEANNTVYVGVGPKRAKWRCLVKNGIVADVMSLTDEGKL